MARTTGMNTRDKSEFGYLLAGDFMLNSKGKAEWRKTFPALTKIKQEARRLQCSRIFYDQRTVTMA